MRRYQMYYALGTTTIVSFLFVSFCLYKTYFYRTTAVDLIIHNGIIITMDPQRRIISEGAIAIQGDHIIAVGPSSKIMHQYTTSRIIDAHKNAILPGFINGHTHAAMSLFRGVADDFKLDDWLNQHILPLEKKHVTPDFVYWGTVLGCLEMIRGGITTVVDMYLFEGSAAQAFNDMGMRAIAGYNIIDENDIRNAENYIKQWQHHALVTPAVAPHSPYSCTKEVLIHVKNLSNTYHIPITTHIAETENCAQTTQKLYGKRPLPYLKSIGFLSDKLIAAHLVHINETDIDLLKQYQVGAIHNPTSNLKLSSGIAPITEMLRKGIAVGLGTDGAASTNLLSIMSEIKLAALVQKIYMKNPRALDAQTALELATIRGAQAIHRDHEIGSIEVGKKADIIIIALDSYRQKPLYNVISQIVYASETSDVTTTIIDGKILMHHQKLIYQPSLFNQLDERITFYHDAIKHDLKQSK